MPNGEIPSNKRSVPPINAIQFTIDSFKYGFQSFYKLGLGWWILTVFYCGYVFYTNQMIANLPEFGFYPFIFEISVPFIISFLELPYLNIGLKFYSSGESDPKNTEDAFSQLWPYFWACFIFTVALVPLYIPDLLEGRSEVSSLNALIALVILFWVFYCLYKMFPYFFIVLDKKLGPVDAFKYSLEITNRQFTPIITMYITILIIYNFFDQVPFSLGYLVSGPVITLAGIHAYKQLDVHHQALQKIQQVGELEQMGRDR